MITDKGHSLDLWIVYIYWCNGLMWFRWFGNGRGYKIKDSTKHDLLFSERNGYRGFMIGKWYIGKLRK